MLVPALAAAQATNADVRAEYDAGARAYEAKDFARAAALFAHADEVSPNPLVLKLALAAATQAEDPVLAMTLVLRAEARAVDGSLADVAKHARGRFARRVGMLRVSCFAHGACQASVGPRRASDGQMLVVTPGEVEAVVASEGRSAVVRATVPARSVVDLVEPAPAASPAPAPAAAPIGPAPAPVAAEPRPSARASGVSPVFFWAGVAATAVLGGVAVASGVDTVAKHDAYVASRTAADRDQGVRAEERTNVLLLGAAGVALVTGVLGVFFTRWRGADAKVALSPHGASVRGD
ncbi:MAG: hypothetical protein JWP97_1951 [Labilithrix sp.]|nr:hypothetical protein [Labilithrix sp.]